MPLTRRFVGPVGFTISGFGGGVFTGGGVGVFGGFSAITIAGMGWVAEVVSDVTLVARLP